MSAGRTGCKKLRIGLSYAMTSLLEQAFERLQTLPPEMQDQAAHMLLLYVGGDEAVVPLSAAEEASFQTSFAQAKRGEFATDEQIRAIWAKHGL